MSVKRTTETERPGASLFECGARVGDAISGAQGVSSEAAEALTFWLLLGQAKSNKERRCFIMGIWHIDNTDSTR